MVMEGEGGKERERERERKEGRWRGWGWRETVVCYTMSFLQASFVYHTVCAHHGN